MHMKLLSMFQKIMDKHENSILGPHQPCTADHTNGTCPNQFGGGGGNMCKLNLKRVTQVSKTTMRQNGGRFFSLILGQCSQTIL